MTRQRLNAPGLTSFGHGLEYFWPWNEQVLAKGLRKFGGQGKGHKGRKGRKRRGGYGAEARRTERAQLRGRAAAQSRLSGLRSRA